MKEHPNPDSLLMALFEMAVTVVAVAGLCAVCYFTCYFARILVEG